MDRLLLGEIWVVGVGVEGLRGIWRMMRILAVMRFIVGAPNMVSRNTLTLGLLLLQLELLLLEHLLGGDHNLERSDLKTCLLRQGGGLVNHRCRGHVEHLMESVGRQVAKTIQTIHVGEKQKLRKDCRLVLLSCDKVVGVEILKEGQDDGIWLWQREGPLGRQGWIILDTILLASSNLLLLLLTDQGSEIWPARGQNSGVDGDSLVVLGQDLEIRHRRIV